MKAASGKRAKVEEADEQEQQPRLKQRAVLTPQELELLQQYKLLEETVTARPKAVNTDDRAKQKAALVAAAAAREKALAEQKARQRGAMAKRKAAEAVPAASDAIGGGMATASAAGAAGDGGAAGAKRPDNKAKHVAPKEWDIAAPGWPFEGMTPMVATVSIKDNPHLEQNDVGFFSVPLEKLPKTLDARMGRKKYSWVPKNKRTTLHVGVRKLLMQEIDFLNRFGEKDTLVVYVGAAPGQHIRVLVEYFPDLRFVLVDSSPFRCDATTQVEHWVQQDPYNESVLMGIKSRPGRKLFISDMHTGGSSDRQEAVDQYVAADMEKQMEWHQRLAPVASLLKFRLPWEEGSTPYLDGELCFSCFAPQTTTETRLLVGPEMAGKPLRDYDHKAYEEHMFFFNRMVRVQYYEHDVTGADLDHCYDCARTVQILREYLIKSPQGFAAPRDAANGHLLGAVAETELAAEVAKRHELISKALVFQKVDPSMLLEQQAQQLQRQRQQQEVQMLQQQQQPGDDKPEEDGGKTSPVRTGGTADEEAPEYGMLLGGDDNEGK